jgi:subtilisin-like proprotein convertase family protein
MHGPRLGGRAKAMPRRMYNYWFKRRRGAHHSTGPKAGRGGARSLMKRNPGQRFWIELLEQRCVLAASPFELMTSPGDPGIVKIPTAATAAASSQPATTTVVRPTNTSGLSDEELASVANDPNYIITPSGGVVPIDPAFDVQQANQGAGAADAPVVDAVPPFPYDQTFLLHSNPGATKVIYLDFDGYTTSGTFWNTDFTNGQDFTTPPYDFNGNPAFSNAELEQIQRIWERVTEDFLPFNVDVTTEDPGVEALRNLGGADDEWGIRVVMGEDQMNTGAGGIAYIGSFTWDTDTPCFVFNPTETGVAEAISHEVGHTLGLLHDGDPPFGYYQGHGTGATSWAPIMGVGYYVSLVQWSEGDYPNANNQEDDLDTITSQNGFDYLPDDYGDTSAAASPFNISGSDISAEGFIGQTDDVDFFTFATGSGHITIDIDPFYHDPDLDILATLYDSSGGVVATSNPVDALNASFSLDLPGGTYFLSIDGTGRDPIPGDPGYPDYGSLGFYSIAGTVIPPVGLVGVDFDIPGGVSPVGWTIYSGPQPTVLTDLTNESGFPTNFDLTISTTGGPILSYPTTINADTIPSYTQSLAGLDGYIFDSNATWTFKWSDLDPETIYNVYVFGLTSLISGLNNVVIAGAGDPVVFNQSLSTNNLFINDQAGSSDLTLADFSRAVTSTGTGEITITVSAPPGSLGISLSGLALRPIGPSSIAGQKWNDLNGDGLKDTTEPGLEGWTIFIDENGNSQFDAAVTQTATSTAAPIPIDNYATVTSTVFFQGLTTIEDIDVSLDISHSYDADLNVFLISPSGKRVELFTDVGGAGDNFHQTILDDEALSSITNAAAPFTGSFRPEGLLSDFDGDNPNGYWTLEVTDDAAGDMGVLNGWSLTVTGNERSTVTDSEGNYQFTSLKPGTYHLFEVMQPGWTQTHAPAPVTVGGDEEVIDVDFGNRALPGSISGQKWNDVDGDGIKDPEEHGMEGWTITLSASSNLTFDSDDVPVDILDLDTVTSDLTVPPIDLITDVNVELSLVHTYDSDLVVNLISPSGTVVNLFTYVGGSGDNFTDTVFDDEASTSIDSGTPPFTGSFIPFEPLSTFDGEDATGTWTLEITDDAGLDVGTLLSWSLSFTTAGSGGGTVTTITDANGNYTFTGLAPGAYAIDEVLQPGWVQTYAPPVVVVGAGEDVANVDIGNHGVAGSIQGQKWNDKNGDGIKQPGEPGLEGWTIYLDENRNGVLDEDGFETTVSSNVAYAITDYATTQSPLLFQGPSGNQKVTVTLDITHTYDADLDVYLVSPTGTRVKLFSDVGASSDNFTATTFDDAALTAIADGTAPFTGVFQPMALLSTFANENPNGVWTLEVFDDSAGDTGTLNGWSLTITGFEKSTTTDADGFYEFTDLPFTDYAVKEVQQPGWVQTFVPPIATIAPGDEVINVDLGNHTPVGSVSGKVFKDVAGDGILQPSDPGLAGWTVYLDENGNGQLDLDSLEKVVLSDIPTRIDDALPTTYSSLWFDAQGRITDVNLTLNIQHTYDSDLTAYLIGPSGTRVKLFSGVGGSGDNFLDTGFDDQGENTILVASAPFPKVYRPEEPLSAFNGQNPNGLWTLEITDSKGGDFGYLNSWSIEILGGERSTVTDAAGFYTFAGLDPGDYDVLLDQKPGWIRTLIPAEPVTVGPGQNIVGFDFGERVPVHLEGDYNRDTIVDAADYLIWRLQRGLTVANFAGADGDGDGDVDQDDYNVWLAHFGESLQSQGAAAAVTADSTTNGDSSTQPADSTAVSTNSATITVGEVNSAQTTSAAVWSGDTLVSTGKLVLTEYAVTDSPRADAVFAETANALQVETASVFVTESPVSTAPQAAAVTDQRALGPSTLSQPAVSSLLKAKPPLDAVSAFANDTSRARPIDRKALFELAQSAATGSDLALLAWLSGGQTSESPAEIFGDSYPGTRDDDAASVADDVFATLADCVLEADLAL